MQDNTINPQNQNSATGPVVGPPPDITPTVPTDTLGVPPVPPSSPVRRRALIPTILGLVLLVVGVGAGLLLVQQQQIFKQKAASCLTTTECSANQECINGQCVTPSTGTSDCSNGCCTISGNNPNGYYIKKCTCSSGTGACNSGCVNAGTSACVDHPSCGSSQIDVVNSSGQEASLGGGRTEQLYNSGTTCTTSTGGGGGGGACSSDYCAGPDQCRSQGGTPGAQGKRPSGGDCITGTVMCCGLGGSGGGGGTTTTTPSKKACGQTCSQDSECVTGAQDQGITVGCINGICANRVCATKTTPGSICSCDTLNACGQPCGAAVGLCQAGSQCGFITGNTQCTPPGTIGDITKTFCLPTAPNNGFTTGQCTGIATIYLKKPDGTVVNNQADVIAACQPQATASCTSITAYDTSWNPLTPAQLSALKAGDKVRFTVAGTTTSGVFDKARFTINGNQQAEVTTKRPNSADFYQEYTIPTGATSFTVTSQLHHQALNQWF